MKVDIPGVGKLFQLRRLITMENEKLRASRNYIVFTLAAPEQDNSYSRTQMSQIRIQDQWLQMKKWLRESIVPASLRTCVSAGLVACLVTLQVGCKGPKPNVEFRQTEFRRTPHLDAPNDRSLRGGEDFEVRVYLNRDASRPGEEGQSVVVRERELPPILQFSVWLDGSSNLEVRGPAVQTIRIARDQDKSTEAIYQVHVRETSQDLTNARLTASFSYNQRPVGFVSRAWTGGTTSSSDQSSEFLTKPDDQPPDLTVQIHTNAPGQYTCTVSTPHLTDFDDQPHIWPLHQNADEFIKEHLADFTATGRTPRDRLLRLQAAGIAFYEAAPENFQSILWELIKRDVLKTIYIVTDEPSFPWELMIPSPADDPTAQRQPLGVEFTVGRWITKRSVSPPQQIIINDALVLAGPFDNEEADTIAADEVAQIAAAFPSEQVTPATLEKLEEMLDRDVVLEKVNLLHFVCHGKSGIGRGRQVLSLAESTELDSITVPAIKAFRNFFKPSKGTVVFLNACEVGSLEPALVGVGGFPQVFASLRAGAVIAPLWSVKHKVARKAAGEFYNRLRSEPMTSMASIIRDIRRKAYQEGDDKGEDSYAAYCFYGDPLCAQVPHRPGQ